VKKMVKMETKKLFVSLGLMIVVMLNLGIGIVIAASGSDGRFVVLGETKSGIFGVTVSTVTPSTDELLGKYETVERPFIKYVFSDTIVYEHSRKIDDAIVEGDRIVYQFDNTTKDLKKRIIHWRDNLPEHLPRVILKGEAECVVKGEVQFTNLYLISPDSVVFPLELAPENPCWVVRSVDNGSMVITIIDAIDGTILGYGISPPYTGFALAGPNWGSCDPYYTVWGQNAETWFETMGYDTEMVDCPTDAKVRSHIQSTETAMFYELAHGNSYYFHNICPDSERITATEVETWIASYTKMPFTFLGSCEGMCNLGSGTLSYEFRKGSMDDTITVGYCGMGSDDCDACWWDSLNWQSDLFDYMNQGWTVKAAFDQAMIDYPSCANGGCMRFVGDDDFKVVPIVKRVPAPPNIISFAPPSPVFNNETESRIFNITIDSTVDVKWFINGTLMQTNTSVTEASYTNTSIAAGYWNVSAVASDIYGADIQTWWWTVYDITPPASVTNLHNVTYEKTYINWTWDDPVDADFSHVMVYLNSDFATNVSKGVQFYNATSLDSDTEYTLSTRTVDEVGNINETWVNHTAKTKANVPPTASFTYLPKGATEEIAIESVGDICVGYMAADVIQTFKAVGDTIAGIDLNTIWGGFEIWVMIEDLNGTILGTSEHASSQEGWTHLEFSSPVVVTPGETYKILGGGSNEGVWISCSNPYPDGGLIYPYPPPGGKDMLFKLYSYAYPVEFTDNSTDSDGTITVWYWDFDDGTNSTEQHPLHNYTAIGIYTITFNVTDNDGATDSTSENISVNPPIASFMYRPILPTTADLIVFNASASYGGNGTITNYEWDWTSDGTIDDTGVATSHQYPAEGTYTVTLTVTNNHGATDNASHNITVTIPLGEAVDNTGLSWSTISDSEYGKWFGQSTTYYHDGDAGQSGRIGNLQSTYIQTNVTGPGNVTFYWKVSSEADYDFLRFYIDDVEQANISGEVDWHQMSFNISAGNHTLKWSYAKDEYVKAGSDCGWLDKVGYQIPMEGDVNGDRHVTVADSILLQDYLADPAAHPLNDCQLTSANTYEIAPDPTTINIYDVMYIQKWLSDPSTPLWDEEHDQGITVPPQP